MHAKVKSCCSNSQVPVGLPASGRLAGSLGVAYDGMRVRLALLPGLPRLLPAIVAALGDADVDVMEGVAAEYEEPANLDVEIGE
jgi:hypothetical protein